MAIQFAYLSPSLINEQLGEQLSVRVQTSELTSTISDWRIQDWCDAQTFRGDC